MFDIGWTELLVIGVIALIVVGPKDLPKMFRTLGQMTAKARNMAREFQRAMDEAADDSGVKDMARDLRKATSAKDMGLDDIDGSGAKPRKPGGARTPRAGKASARHATAKAEGDVPDKAEGDTSDDAAAEAAADAELDTVTREMDRLRAERKAASAQRDGAQSAAPKDTAQDTAQDSAQDSAAHPATADSKTRKT